MVFKNEKQLKDFLLQKCRVALTEAQEQIYQIIDGFIKDFYTDYSPEMYERTYQLYHSLVKTRISSVANGFETQIFFDLDGLKYSKPSWQGGRSPSGEEVFEAAKKGLHGAVGDAGGGYKFHYEYGNTGINVWEDPMQRLNAEAIEILKNRLIAAGIPIK